VLMPQKRNPYALTMVRGEAGVLIGRATGMLALSKSPSARSDNLIFAYGEAPRALDLAARATRLMAGVVRELTVDTARMRDALYGGFAQAADLAEFLMVTAGLDYRSAYELVGAAVRRAAAEGLRGVDLTGAMLDAAAVDAGIATPSLAGVDLTAALDPAAIVRGRQTGGGAAPEVVRRMAKECGETADALLTAIRARTARFAAADAAVIAQAARAIEEE
jgi:argininosuccinate lyase